jgi:DNA ligase-1
MKIVELFKMIEMEGSSLIKDQIVRENLDAFKDTLKSIYEDCYGSQKYFIKKAPITSNYGAFTIDTSYNIFSLALRDLANRVVTGNEAINYIIQTLEMFTQEDQEWLIRILMKDLKIGYSKTSWEKIFGKGNDEYEVSLAINLDKVKGVDVLDGTYFASRKLDGVRCVAICEVHNGELISLELKSRQGKTFTTLDKLKPAIEKFICRNFEGVWVLDGEVCLVDENGDEHFDWIMKEINRKNHTIENPRYKLFDLIKGEDFFKGEGDTKFEERYNELYETWTYYAFDEERDLLQPIVQERITCQEDFDRWSQYVANNGWEGFMLRKNVPYKGGRTKDLIKVKKFQDDEYVVIGYECGDVKYGTETFRDVVSNLHIIHKGNRVSVGSGISKEQRILWRKQPEKIIGKEVTIQYFEETVDSKTGMFSLRFPVLKHVYENKREV